MQAHTRCTSLDFGHTLINTQSCTLTCMHTCARTHTHRQTDTHTHTHTHTLWMCSLASPPHGTLYSLDVHVAMNDFIILPDTSRDIWQHFCIHIHTYISQQIKCLHNPQHNWMVNQFWRILINVMCTPVCAHRCSDIIPRLHWDVAWGCWVTHSPDKWSTKQREEEGGQ